MKTIEIFTDGSFSNKKSGPKAGYGIYFPNKELPDISRKFSHPPLTNQRAELYAIYVALILVDKFLKFDNVIIYSDSMYSIKCATSWIKDWVTNNWKTATNKPVMNQDILKPLYYLLQKFKNKLEFIHVASHTGKKDYKSIGNAKADQLALDGSNM